MVNYISIILNLENILNKNTFLIQKKSSLIVFMLLKSSHPTLFLSGLLAKFTARVIFIMEVHFIFKEGIIIFSLTALEIKLFLL